MARIAHASAPMGTSLAVALGDGCAGCRCSETATDPYRKHNKGPHINYEYASL